MLYIITWYDKTYGDELYKESFIGGTTELENYLDKKSLDNPNMDYVAVADPTISVF